jgi:cytochrome c-type biogenesis protein CcmE
MTARMKILVGGIVVVAALAWLGIVGFQESKAYYITVDEFASSKGTLEGKTLKLAGEVVAGSIDRTKPHLEFAIGNLDKKIKVQYVGKDIIPDTFKDGTKALVEGKATPEGIFQASHIEAKCASKYEAEYEKRSGSQ